MAYSQADLDKIDRAIARGVKSVEIAGKRIAYNSLDELKAARDHVARQLEDAAGAVRTRQIRIVATKGL